MSKWDRARRNFVAGKTDARNRTAKRPNPRVWPSRPFHRLRLDGNGIEEEQATVGLSVRRTPVAVGTANHRDEMGRDEAAKILPHPRAIVLEQAPLPYPPTQ